MRYLSLFLLPFFLTACNSGNDSAESAGQQTGSGKVSPVNCLKQADYDYASLLSKATVQELYPLDQASVKTDAITGQGEYNSIYYQWPSDRPGQPSGLGVDFPDENFIGLGAAQPYNEKLDRQGVSKEFDRHFKALTDAQVKQMEADIDKKQANESEETRALSKKMIGARKDMGFEPVAATGHGAYWRFSKKNGGELAVLNGNEKFSVYVKVSLDPDENLKLAKKVAAAVIKKCS